MPAVRAALLLLVYTAAAVLAYWAGAEAPWAQGTDRALGAVAGPASTLAQWAFELIPAAPKDITTAGAALAVVVAPAVAAAALAAAAVAPKPLRAGALLAFLGVLTYGYASTVVSSGLSAAAVIVVVAAAAVPVYLVSGAPITLFLTAASGIVTGRLVIAALHGSLPGMENAGASLEAWLGSTPTSTTHALLAVIAIAPAVTCIGVIRRR